MLPVQYNDISLSQEAAGKLKGFYYHFCSGDNRKRYGLGHMVYACVACVPMILTPELANLLWLNFKTYDSGQAQNNIAPVAVTDFLLSPLCRQVGYRQYEVLPEIRNYLLFLQKDGSWFHQYDVRTGGMEQLKKAALFLRDYLVVYKKDAVQMKGDFQQLNNWVVQSFLSPATLVVSLADSLKEHLQQKNDQGLLQVNMLLERFKRQYDQDIVSVGSEEELNPFHSLYQYSRLQAYRILKRALPEGELSAFDKIRDEYTNDRALTGQGIELPIPDLQGERMKRRKNKQQRVIAVMVAIDDWSGKLVQGCDKLQQALNEQTTTFANNEIEWNVLYNEAATKAEITSLLNKAYDDANPEDIVLFYLAGECSLDEDSSGKLTSNFRCYPMNKQKEFTAFNCLDICTILRSRSAEKNVQTVMLLDGRAGYGYWESAGAIFLGAYRKKTVDYRRVVPWSLADNLAKIIRHTKMKVTYGEVQLLLRNMMEQEHSGGEDSPFPVLLANAKEERTYLFSREMAPENDLLLMAYNVRRKCWRLLVKTFGVPSVGKIVGVYYMDGDLVQGISEGIVSTKMKDAYVVNFSEGTSLLKEDAIFRVMFLSTVMYYSNEVMPLPIIEGLLKGLEEDRKERVQLIRSAKEPKAGGPPSLIFLENKDAAAGFSISFYPGTLAPQFPMQFLVQAKSAIQKLAQFKQLTFLASSFSSWQNESFKVFFHPGKQPLQITDDAVQWTISEQSLLIEGNKIRFKPLVVNLATRGIPLFCSIYVLDHQDLSISRLYNSAAILPTNENVEIVLEMDDLLQKISAQERKISLQILFSRDPIITDFSQEGII